MKRLSALFVVVVIMGLTTVTFAQRNRDMRFRGSDGWGAGTHYERLFDNANVLSYVGSVVRVDTLSPGGREWKMGPAMRLLATLDGVGEIPIHLGPMWFAINQDISFPAGERIEVRGFRANISGDEFIMAVEIRSRNRVMRFRDDDGFPFWAVHRPR